MNDLRDIYRYLIGGYYGMCLMDEYPQKEFILNDIKNYIKDFCSVNDMSNIDLEKEELDVKDNVTDRVKLQDLLIVLNKINASMDIVFLVKNKLNELGRRDYF